MYAKIIVKFCLQSYIFLFLNFVKGLTSSRDQGKDGDPLNRDCGDQVIVLEGDDDHPRDPKEIASQLQEVNNSIITFMKAVEEKTDEEELENKAGVAMLNE